MSLTDVLYAASMRELDRVASVIEGEMKGVVSKHSRSGEALGAIHIEETGRISRFVGGTGGEGTWHLAWLNDGNGGRGAVITANHKKRNGGRGALGKWPDGIPGYGWRTSVHGYDGIHFVEDIASRHR